MKSTGLIAVIMALAVFLPSCGKEIKSLKEELRVVKEENSFLKAENIALKKEIEELYKKLEEKEKAKAVVPQAQLVPANTPKNPQKR